ncbi:DNA starvation/stationary phase protection protein [Paenibacillus sp. N1-5-1-14]|uniref:Dps family protein n=1 Tax=Paenibacillus radicibacter TaxID=2972488 RepID=UPI0021591B38|nr:Dps family protein [Paenibacillus radicibacter]MCR8644825.1 DNA starvation/stationary phase protection protein [Paenibacillus radicibacter]
MNPSIANILNKQIANWGVMYIKLHHYHWYVKGTHFFTLHEKFEELYDEASGHLDELAERLLASGGQPLSRLKDFLQVATIQEAGDETTADGMVRAVISDFNMLIEELKEGNAIAEEAGDDLSADLLLSIRTELDKHVWMLNAYLG